MNYANICYEKNPLISYKETDMVNIGDTFQYLALQDIYEEMEICKDKIIHLYKDQLWSYQGEPVILPINCLFTNYTHGTRIFPFSEKIVPVFLGVSFGSLELREEDICYLKQYEPIGCRDEYTRNRLRDSGVNAYTAGCISASLKRRSQQEENKDTVFLIDIPNEILPFLLRKYKNVEVMSHIISLSDVNTMENYVENRYNEYIKRAKLVITSRLHAAIPCAAAGIPVVFITKKRYSTFSWIEKWMPIYLTEDIEDINWNPEVMQYGTMQGIMKKLAYKRIMQKQDYQEEMLLLDDFYSNRNRNDYYTETNEMLHFIRDNLDQNKIRNYCIWGITPYAEQLYKYISVNYPEARLTAVFDKYRIVDFKGHRSQQLENIKKYKQNYMFVVGYRACLEAKEFLRNMEWDADYYYLFYDAKR